MGGTGFEKYEGLGNDFIVVEGADAWERERVVRACDRHFGVGADGVLVVAPARSPGARARMIVSNADGSRPEMCGNGLRCVALYLARKDGLTSAEYVVDTDAGPRRCEVERRGGEGSVSIDMGRAEPLGEHRARFGGAEHVFRRIATGNPHAVHLDGMLDAGAIDRLAPEVSRAIEGGANVEFVETRGPRAYDVVVWERGVGRTLACGTGAVATVAALALAGRAPYGEPVEIRLPGGPLEVTVTRETLETRMKGPARCVFRGELP
jgi:diaminopimelate epimerase